MPEKPFLQRKSPRLRGYDYSQEGAYFVTICTAGRTHLFGKIVDGVTVLNTLGQIAESGWAEIPTHFPQVELDLYVIMPNHVHGIVFIVDAPGDTKMMRTVGTRHASSLRQPLPKQWRPNGVKSGSLGAIVGSYKSATTKRIKRLGDTSETLVWQGRYYDHIIRNEQSLNKIREYILYNPARWPEDTLYSAS